MYEDEEIEVFQLLAENLTRVAVAKALGRMVADPFNIVENWNVRYYSPELAAHAKVLELYRRFGPRIVVYWKRLPTQERPH